MPKFFGAIGFGVMTETAPGVYSEDITEINYSIDIFRNTVKQESSGEINRDMNISNKLSFVADDFALSNINNMKYVIWMGSKWTVNSISVEPPRLVLQIGGLYNV